MLDRETWLKQIRESFDKFTTEVEIGQYGEFDTLEEANDELMLAIYEDTGDGRRA